MNGGAALHSAHKITIFLLIHGYVTWNIIPYNNTRTFDLCLVEISAIYNTLKENCILLFSCKISMIDFQVS
jgi:hypothetical protein